MATLDELRTEATAEIEAAKPLFKQVDGKRLEFTDDDYDQAITDLANSKYDQQQNGYKIARQEAYKPIGDQLDAGLFGSDAKTSQWYLDIKTIKTDNPKP